LSVIFQPCVSNFRDYFGLSFSNPAFSGDPLLLLLLLLLR